MRHVDQHRGRVEVEGVVASEPANQSLALIDRKEFVECGLKGCTNLVLPVRWAGSMPKAGQAIRLHGRVQETGGKLIFVADSLDAVAAGGNK